MIISGKENRKSSQEMRPSDKNRTFWYMNKYKEWEFLGLKFQHGELEFFFSAMSTIRGCMGQPGLDYFFFFFSKVVTFSSSFQDLD